MYRAFAVFQIIVFSSYRPYLSGNFGHVPSPFSLPLLPVVESENIYTHTCVYIFCALPLDVPLGRSASCVLLLTNVQSARAVKTPRFAGTPVRSSHFLSLFLSLFFFQFSPEAFGIIFFFSVRRTSLFVLFLSSPVTRRTRFVFSPLFCFRPRPATATASAAIAASETG